MTQENDATIETGGDQGDVPPSLSTALQRTLSHGCSSQHTWRCSLKQYWQPVPIVFWSTPIIELLVSVIKNNEFQDSSSCVCSLRDHLYNSCPLVLRAWKSSSETQF
eukprot:3531832-Amphidinium_carterae.1